MLILAGSFAIPVYQHTCIESNSVAKTLFISSSNCHEKEEAHVEKFCCEKKDVKVDHDCCSDEVSAFKVSFFKVHAQEYQFTVCETFSNPIPVFFVETSFPDEKRKVLAFTDLPPPKLSNRLALLQVWRI